MAQLQLTLADLDAELAGKVLDRTGIAHMFNSVLSISSKEKLHTFQHNNKHLFTYFDVQFDLLHFYISHLPEHPSLAEKCAFIKH